MYDLQKYQMNENWFLPMYPCSTNPVYNQKIIYTDCILRSWLLQNPFIGIVLHSELNPNPKYLAPYHSIHHFSHYSF